MREVTQRPIQPKTDLRDMLRQHLIRRSLARMEAAEKRRQAALNSGDLEGYCRAIQAVANGSAD